MTSTMRKTMRGTAAGLGALAIIAGASACGALTGGDNEGDKGDEPAVEEPAEGEGSDEGSDSEEADDSEESAEEESAETDGHSDSEEAGGSEEGSASEETEGEDADADAEGEDTDAEGTDGAASGEPIPEEELTVAGDRFYAFLEAVVAQDAEAACGLVIDNSTGKPAAGAGFDDCIASFDSSMGEDFDPATMDFIERSMIEMSDNGDGRAEISMMGEAGGVYMAQADDGQWYVDAESDF